MTASYGSIIAVDDDPESLRLLVDVLSNEGYTVRPADSGDLALTSAKAYPPDLFLLDIRMPGLAGFELCRVLKATPETSEVPIIFLSALKALDERVEGFRAGAVDFVSKPFQREELLARVRTHLELGRLRRDLEEQVIERTRALQRSKERLQLELAERRHAEQAMRESESRFRTMADASPALIWVINSDLLCTFANKAWMSFMGRDHPRTRGSVWGDRIHADDASTWEQITGEAIAGRQSYQVEFRALRKDGQYRWLVENGSPMMPEGTFSGYVASCIDVTELKQAAEERLASQKMESLGALAAGIAHDFNNLTASIIAEADLALSVTEADSGARDHIDQISAVALRATEIVDLLLTYAGTGCAPGFQSVDPNAIVIEMLQIIRSSFAGKVQIESRLAEDIPPMRANGAQIRRVVMNLVMNGAEAAEETHGTVSVSTALRRFDETTQVGQVFTLAPGEYVEVAVTDTGPGMTETALAKVFDPFFSTKFLGRGLGLAVVQGIIRTHEGAIRVTSQPKAGSTFEVLLPVAAIAQKAEGPSGLHLVSRHNEKSPITVLLVDDEHSLRRAVTSGLERQGFVVLPAWDGEEALNVLRKRGADIDVVFLDLTLPGISGNEVYAEIRQRRPDLNVILTSAGDAGGRGQFAAEDGRRPVFLRKPYRMKELVATIREAIAR